VLLDIDYLFIGLPAVSLSIWAQWKIVSARAAARMTPSSSGLTGAEAALRVMQAAGARPVQIEPASGQLADHYDPGRKILRLSEQVCSGRSLADIGVAAHEACHVPQHSSHLPLLLVRSAIVPLANLGSTTVWMLALAGLLLGIFRFIIWAVFLLWIMLFLQLLNLPVELDASRRARTVLLESGMVNTEEEQTVAAVLGATAWTHVAGVVTDVWPLRRFRAPSRQAVRPGSTDQSP
jgi:Zn-dependent membrane protease YugP